MGKNKVVDLIKKIQKNPLSNWLEAWDSIDHDDKIEYSKDKKMWGAIQQLACLLNKKNIDINTQYHILNVIRDLASNSETYNQNVAPLDFDVDEMCALLNNQFQLLTDSEIRDDALRVINIGVRVLKFINNPKSIPTLLLFIKPNVDDALEDRVTEFALESLRSIISYTSERYRHEEFRKRHPIILSDDMKKLVLNSMLEGHLKDSRDDLEIFCKCQISAINLPVIEGPSEAAILARKTHRKSLRKKYFSDEISYSEYEKGTEEYDEKCSYCDSNILHSKHSHCELCGDKICNYCIKTASESPLYYRRAALNIARLLDDNAVIKPILVHLLSEDDEEVCTVLRVLEEHWKPEYLKYVVEQLKRDSGDLIYSAREAIRIIGKRGSEDHIEMLLTLLEKYSKLQGKGHRDSRDAVENALFELREYSHEILICITAESFHNKGYSKTVERIVKKISRIHDSRPKSKTDWKDFREWRSNKGEEIGQNYLPAILTDDVVFKIIERQPIDYLQLLEVDGIGPRKVVQYGSELLQIIRKNQPDIDAGEYLLPPWNFPNRIEDWLAEILIQIDNSDWESKSDDERAVLLKNKNCHTKAQLRVLACTNFSDFEEKDVVNKMVDWTLKWSKNICKAGKSRGVRYTRLL
jgi:hypothetical protein